MTVLIVDDDPVIARLLRQVLEEDGYAVRCAHNLQEAREAAGPFAVVLADVRLPNGDGRNLRDVYPGVPFISMSGFPGELPDLPKPFSVSQFRQAVREAVGGQ